MGRGLLRRILTLAVTACYGISLFLTVNALAASNIFVVENAEITELSGTAGGNISVVDDANISSDIVFQTLGDEAKLKITLKNTDEKEHAIESISDNNENPYVSYQYDSYEDLRVEAGESFDFLVTIKYQNPVSDVSERVQIANIKFAIKYFDIDEPDIIPIVPDTGGNFVAPKNEVAVQNNLIALILSTIGVIVLAVIVVKNHKKSAKIVAVFVAVFVSTTIATAVKAATIETNTITINVNYALYDKLIVTYEDGGGNQHEEVVNYKGKVSLDDQEKTGYTFLGWEDENGDPFDLDTEIVKDITVKPVFRKNNYTISFDKNQGTGSMSNLPMVYDEEKQLSENTFARTGYSFNGWNAAANGSGDSYTDKQSVKNLVSADNGSITLYAQWQANSYVVVFNANAPESTVATGSMSNLDMTYDTPKKLTNNAFNIDGYKFVSWNTKADGTGETIYNGAQVNNLAESGNITLYAVWKEKTFACKFATELHEEACKNSSSGGCANNGGYRTNDTISYGSLASEDSPKAGDAFDCDVNFDGVYDPATERFYYLHTLDGKAVMFYYDNLVQADKEYPDALGYLPTTSTWSNPDLTTYDNNRTARFATKDDISLGCGGVDPFPNNSLLSCVYLFEGTSFANSSNRKSTYILEPDGTTYYRVHKTYRNISTGNSTLHAAPRPVIEVPTNKVQGFDDGSEEEVTDEVVVYDITSNAVKNYYANVGSWKTSKAAFLTAMKDNYDTNACKATAINPQTSSDFPDEYRYSTTGNVFCDKPKGYDTKATGTIKVYLSNEDTKIKGSEATYVSVKNGVITNMIPGTTYYWESTTDSSIHGFVKATGDRRLIDLPTARNVRDLGGIKGADGKTIEYGRIMRGERLASDDVTALKNLGIDKEYDVRNEDNGVHFDEGYERHAMTNYDIIEEGNYIDAREALTSLMTDIAAGNSVYIHCTHGSDRTGTLVYLAEALLGVSNEDRDRDFDLTALSGRADRTRFYDHMVSSSSVFNPERKYVYMKNELPDEGAVREWYFRGSTNRAADEQLIENFRNAILK